MNIQKLRADNDGKLPAYAWPGGYPVYYLDGEDNVLCSKCANKSLNDFIEKFRPIVGDINYEDASLYCDQCSERIESAYAEEDATTTEGD